MNPRDPQKPHIFVSYVHQNNREVDRLCQALEARDLRVWRDKNEILPGQDWQHAIRQAITSGDYFLACFSDEYIARDKSYMNEELELAIGELRKYPRDRTWFIPVLLSECEMPDWDIGAGRSLKSFQWVELYTDFEEGIERVLRVIRSNVRHWPEIRVSSVGLRNKTVYLAHAKGKWGPEGKDSDFKQHPLTLAGDDFVIQPDFLERDEEFKIIVFVSDDAEAQAIVQQRRAAGVHIGDRGEDIDFDPDQKTLWLLSHNYEIAKLGKWNQNNVYRPR